MVAVGTADVVLADVVGLLSAGRFEEAGVLLAWLKEVM